MREEGERHRLLRGRGGGRGGLRGRGGPTSPLPVSKSLLPPFATYDPPPSALRPFPFFRSLGKTVRRVSFKALEEVRHGAALSRLTRGVLIVFLWHEFPGGL